MRLFPLAAIALFLGCLACPAKDVAVYLAAGQSNATPKWSTAIDAELSKLNPGQEIVVVNSHQPGAWLKKWWDGGPTGNYTANYNAIWATFHAIYRQGNTPVLKGVFWFQGEGDTGSYVDMDRYKERFKSYIEQLKTDFNAKDLIVVIAVIDANPDPKYDDPQNLVKRTRDQIEYMRKILFELSSEFPGFAIDTRGYKRSDAWHLLGPELSALGKHTAEQFQQKGLAPKPPAP